MTSLTATYDGYAQGHSFLGTRLQLQVKCPSTVVEKTVQAVTKARYSSVEANIAIAARVETVEKFETADSEGGREKTLRGTGECVSVLHLPEGVRLLSPQK